MNIIDSFTVGGVAGHPSMPGETLQKALGSTIHINIIEHELYVPTSEGIKIARQGDRIIAYDNGGFDVEKREGV